MARALTAYLSRPDIPDRPALQAAVTALKLKVVLDEGYAPFVSGYLPCTFDGEDAGCTLKFTDVAADLSPVLADALHGRDVAIGVTWSGDVREEISALAICAALAGGFGALVVEGGETLRDAAALAKTARTRLAEVDG